MAPPNSVGPVWEGYVSKYVVRAVKGGDWTYEVSVGWWWCVLHVSWTRVQ